jgi:hypothetical protein
MARRPVVTDTPPPIDKLVGGFESTQIAPERQDSSKFNFPEFGYGRKREEVPCTTGGGKAVLVMTTSNKATAEIPAGPTVRLCVTKRRPGYLIPVATPDEANEISAAFVDCVKSGTSAESCAKTISSQFRSGPPVLGSAPRRRKTVKGKRRSSRRKSSRRR